MTQYEVFLEEPVPAELQLIVDYYEAQSSGLGERFKNVFYKQLRHVAIPPFARVVRYDDIRFALLKPFAEVAHNWIDEAAGIVSVVGIVSQHRNPDTTWIYGEGEK